MRNLKARHRLRDIVSLALLSTTFGVLIGLSGIVKEPISPKIFHAIDLNSSEALHSFLITTIPEHS